MFHVKGGGHIIALKLVHLSGKVRGWTGGESNWGSGANIYLGTVVTDGQNNRIVPPQSVVLNSGRYVHPGYHSNSPEIVFSNHCSPLLVSSGQEFRIWYLEDLINDTESDNGGQACVDVYVQY